MEALPEGSQGGLPDLNAFRIRPTAYEPDAYSSSAAGSRRVTFDGLPAPVADEEVAARGARSLPVPLGPLPATRALQNQLRHCAAIAVEKMSTCRACM